MLRAVVYMQARVVSRSCRGDRGQATSEYALVILGAAAVALLVLAWATKTNKVGRLLDAIIDTVISKVT